MKKVSDHFSGHSGIYKKYRPNYPQPFYESILNYTRRRENLWDCATGNGQVAGALSAHFKHVYASDISSNQLVQAPVLPNVQYSDQRAEKTNYKDCLFDLITVAQAIHWFDLDAFFKEASRVGRKGGVLAVWGYGLLHFDSAPDDDIIRHFYLETVGPYWAGERKYIDTCYSSIEFNLEDKRDLGGFAIEQPMDLQALLGYLNSWSSVQNYIRVNGENPVDKLGEKLKEFWKPGETKMAEFPIFGTMGCLPNPSTKP